jgi:hypothetical protein
MYYESEQEKQDREASAQKFKDYMEQQQRDEARMMDFVTIMVLLMLTIVFIVGGTTLYHRYFP